MGSVPAPAAPSAPTQLWPQLSATTLGAPAASVTFSSLTGTRYRLNIVCSRAAALISPWVTLNADSGANYEVQDAYAYGGANTAQRGAGATKLQPPATAATGLVWAGEYVIQKPLAAQHAHVLSTQTVHAGAGNSEVGEVQSGRWTNTANLVTTIGIAASAGNFDTGSVFTLCGA